MTSIAGVGEFEGDALGGEQRLVLAEQRGAGLAEDAGEVVAGQVVHLDADREPALELGHQVRRLRAVERPGGDEQDVVGLDRPVLGVDRRPLDDRQQVALHALPRDVGPAARARVVAGDLVDLVDEDDARFLGQAHGGLADLLGVEQAVDLLLEQDRPGLLDRHPARLSRLGHDPLEHVLEVHLHLLEVARAEDRHRCHRAAREGDLDLAVVELAGGEPGPQLVARALAAIGGLARGRRLAFRPRRRRGRRRQEQVEQPLFDPRRGLLLDPPPLGVAHQHDRRLVNGVTLIRHAYVLTSYQRKGYGEKLLNHLLGLSGTSKVYVGTWEAAIWAIKFYQRNGFELVSTEEKNKLLKKYWSIPKRQVETSVVLELKRQLQ